MVDNMFANYHHTTIIAIYWVIMLIPLKMMVHGGVSMDDNSGVNNSGGFGQCIQESWLLFTLSLMSLGFHL